MRDDPVKTLNPAQRNDLRALAALMLPASAEFSVPGADDSRILEDIVSTLDRDISDVREALQNLAELSCGTFAELDDAHRSKIAQTFLATSGKAVATLSRVVLQCYYRDDRVLRSLALEPRPPFPLGHELEQGDWALLDAVRGRTPMWRDVQ
jgi:hypothetical protein